MAKRGYKTMEEAEKAKKDKNELRKAKSEVAIFKLCRNIRGRCSNFK